MGDFLSYGALASPAATDIVLACTATNAQVMQSTRAQFMPTITDGTTTLTGVGTIILDGGTVSGSSGGTAGLGSATFTFSGSGGGGITAGPLFGTTTTFSRPALSTFGTLYGAPTCEDFEGGPISISLNASPGDSFNILTQEVSGSWTLTTLIEPPLQGYGNGSAYPWTGPMVSDGSGKFLLFAYCIGSNPPQFTVQGWNSAGSFDVTYGNVVGTSYHGAVWQRIVWNGTFFEFFISSNNIVWDAFAGFESSTGTTMLIGTPTLLGIGIDGNFPSTSSQNTTYLWNFDVGA
jgi:hypothetical protein